MDSKKWFTPICEVVRFDLTGTVSCLIASAEGDGDEIDLDNEQP